MSALPLPTHPSDPFRLSPPNSGHDSGPKSPPQSPPDLTLFNPSPVDAANIIDDLADPYSTFASIAKSHNTTLEGLTLWMQRPDIASRLDAVESTCTRRSRLLANNHIPVCIHALSCAVSAASYEDAHTAYPEGSMRHDEQRRKGRETLIRMTRVMMQIAKIQPVPSIAKRSEPASPPPAPRLADSFVAPGSDSFASSRASTVPVPLKVERHENEPSGRQASRGRTDNEPDEPSEEHACNTPQSCSCAGTSD